MSQPKFQAGKCIILDYARRELELPKSAWEHIIKDRGRVYFERFFDKIELTLKNPKTVKKSSKMENVVIYERFFDDFYITNTVLGHTYVNVVVNWKTKRILTAYPSVKRKKGRILWPRRR